jgi:hypothetical protein
MIGKFFLDKIDGIVYSTDSYCLWNFYRSIFFGRPFPGCTDKKYTKDEIGEPIDWDVITSNGKVLMKKVDGKYRSVE